MPLSDRAKAGLTAFIRRVVGLDILGPRMDYLGEFPAKVVSQNGDGTLELQPDDSRLPGYSKVPIRYGVPGITATVSGGARCLLAFAGADPQKPVVVGWEGSGGVLVSLNVGPADTVLVRYSDLKTLLDAQTHIGNLGYPTGAPIVVVPSTVGSSVIHVK
jgi:hypothetical protein